MLIWYLSSQVSIDECFATTHAYAYAYASAYAYAYLHLHTGPGRRETSRRNPKKSWLGFCPLLSSLLFILALTFLLIQILEFEFKFRF